MKSTINRSTLFGLLLTLVAFAVSAMLYTRLPDVLPVHWGLRGTADGFLHKPWAIYFYPGMIGAMLLLKLVLPAISPRAFAIEPCGRTFNIIMSALMLFMAYLMGLVYAAALGMHIAVGRAVLGGVGVLFIVTGNLTGKLTRNFFIGIRTPWTLASDEVWFKTHRLGAWLFVLAGLVTLGVALLGNFYVVAVVGFAIAVATPVVFSFVISPRRDLPHGSPE
jgi:uncharacterized membrane protein